MSRGESIGVNQNNAQLGLPDKGRAIKGLVVCNSLDIAFGPTKSSGLRFVINLPSGINRINNFILNSCQETNVSLYMTAFCNLPD